MQQVHIDREAVLHTVELWPKQQEIHDWIVNRVIHHQPAVFFAGQRSGKNILVAEAVHNIQFMHPFETIVVVALTFEQAKCNALPMLKHALASLPEDQPMPEVWIANPKQLEAVVTRNERLGHPRSYERPPLFPGTPPSFPGENIILNRTLVVMDEAPWLPDAESLLIRLGWLGGGVIGFGSPSKDSEVWWFKDHYPRWATWEINPNLPMHSNFIQRRFAQSKADTMRDFGCNIPHTAIAA